MQNWSGSSERGWGDRIGFYVALVLAFASVLLVARAAFGQAPELPELVLAPCPAVEHLHALDADGVPGMWFPRETARCMLGRLAQLQDAVPYFRLLEQRLELGDGRDTLQNRRVEFAVAQARVASDALAVAVRHVREAERAKDAWHRSPFLWMAVGAVLAAGVFALTAYALDSVRNP